MEINNIKNKLFNLENLSTDESLFLFEEIMEGKLNEIDLSGILISLKIKGETKEEIFQVMDDLRSAKVDFLTIGQYLPPTSKHAKLDRFVKPDEFNYYEKIAYSKGFLMVSSSPLTRSSYHASEDFKIMQENRKKNYK